MTQSLHILHIFRSPLGGLFRHVCDLVAEQSKRGHMVGIICDNSTGGAQAEDKLEQIEHLCALGVLRIPMSRKIGLNDLHAPQHISKWAIETQADIIHGHGAKGGAYARLAKKLPHAKCFYTPHGGSLHYSPHSPAGMIYLTLEKLLINSTDGFIFESRYSKDVFEKKVSQLSKPAKVINNGVDIAEFKSVKLAKNSADFVFIGELRELKGLEELLVALKEVSNSEKGRKRRLVIAGTGPDEAHFKARTTELGLDKVVSFIGYTPAREAFAQGRIMVMPSRAESFPYIALEALAAKKPLIATDVGGVSEMYGKYKDMLVEPENSAALQKAMEQSLVKSSVTQKRTKNLQNYIKSNFTTDVMVTSLEEFYQDCGVLPCPASQIHKNLA